MFGCEMGVEQSKEKFRKAISTVDLDRLETRIVFDPTLVSEADMQRIRVAASKSITVQNKLRLSESIREHYKFVEELGGGGTLLGLDVRTGWVGGVFGGIWVSLMVFIFV